MARTTPFGRNKSATHYTNCPTCAPYGEGVNFASNKRISDADTNLRVEGVARPRLRALVGRCKLCRGGGVIAITSAGKKHIESASSQTEAVRYAREAVEAYNSALQLGEV